MTSHTHGSNRSHPTLDVHSASHSQASPQTENVHSRAGSASSPRSRTESVQGSGEGHTERSPLLYSSNKQYQRDENLANNFGKDSPPTSKSPPPKPKLDPTITTHPATIPTPAPQPEEPLININDGGRPTVPPVHAPNRIVQLVNPAGRVSCGCVLKRARMSCCLLSVLIVLGGLVSIALWPTVISTPHHLPHNHTVPTGLVFIEPSNTLARGGARVTLNLTNMTDPSKLQTHYYYGPMPSENLYTETDKRGLPFTKRVIENSLCHLFDPFVFATGHLGGNFTFEIEKKTSNNTNDIIVSLSVFASYEEAVSAPCSWGECTFDDNDQHDALKYSYNNSIDSCGRHHSYYGQHRYFRIAVKSYDQPLENLLLESQLKVNTVGVLNTSSIHSLKACSSLDEDTKTVTCDIPYNPFFSEVGANNRLLIVTDTTVPSVFQPYNNFYTTLTVNSEEGFRGDVIGELAAVVLVTILVVFVLYTYKQLVTYSCRCVKWGVTHHRTKVLYSVLAGEPPPP